MVFTPNFNFLKYNFFSTRNFELPWLDDRSRCRIEVPKKHTPHRTCRKWETLVIVSNIERYWLCLHYTMPRWSCWHTTQVNRLLCNNHCCFQSPEDWTTLQPRFVTREQLISSIVLKKHTSKNKKSKRDNCVCRCHLYIQSQTQLLCLILKDWS